MGNVWCPWLVDAARLAAQGTGRAVIVQAGWESRGHGGLRLVEFVIGHHTGTPETAPGDYPSLGTVQNGRSDLPGPLAQLGLGRSGNIYVIAAGLAYHAGASAYAGYVDLNDESIGIEAEDSGDGVWTDDQLFMYPRLVGALLHYLGRPSVNYASHRTIAQPQGRKPDPTGISDEWMRQQSDAARQEGFDVGLSQAEKDVLWEIAHRVRSMHSYNYKTHGDDAAYGGDLTWLAEKLGVANAEVIAAINSAVASGMDEQAMAEALAQPLATLLNPLIEAGATPEQVEAACVSAVRSLTFAAVPAGDPTR